MKLYSQANIPTKFGTLKFHIFNTESGEEVTAISKGDFDNLKNPIFTRIHSQCVTGEIYGSLMCDCGIQLNSALEELERLDEGLIIYLNQEGRGIGLGNKIKAYSLQINKGIDTVDANLELGFKVDQRSYENAISVLNFFKLSDIALNSNNPLKFKKLKEAGFNVIRKPLKINAYEQSRAYIRTKINKCGHLE